MFGSAATFGTYLNGVYTTIFTMFYDAAVINGVVSITIDSVNRWLFHPFSIISNKKCDDVIACQCVFDTFAAVMFKPMNRGVSESTPYIPKYYICLFAYGIFHRS